MKPYYASSFISHHIISMCVLSIRAFVTNLSIKDRKQTDSILRLQPLPKARRLQVGQLIELLASAKTAVYAG